MALTNLDKASLALAGATTIAAIVLHYAAPESKTTTVVKGAAVVLDTATILELGYAHSNSIPLVGAYIPHSVTLDGYLDTANHFIGDHLGVFGVFGYPLGFAAVELHVE